MASPRLPTKSDFPPNITLDIVPPSTGRPINILILLHGLGDTQTSFTSLGTNLNLPETCCISIRGPNPIPPLFTGSEDPAFTWGDDVLFDEDRGELDLDSGFERCRTMVLDSVITSVLVGKCAYPPRHILFLGFGQGGMAALSLCSSASDLEFGGVISIAGRLPRSARKETETKCKTPVLLLGGSRSSEVTSSRVREVRERFQDVEYVKWAKSEDSMPRSREEMLPIMKFFARRLRSRAGVPEGAVEV